MVPGRGVDLRIRGRGGAAVDGDDARLADHLVEDDRVAGDREGVVAGVVRIREHSAPARGACCSGCRGSGSGTSRCGSRLGRGRGPARRAGSARGRWGGTTIDVRRVGTMWSRGSNEKKL